MKDSDKTNAQLIEELKEAMDRANASLQEKEVLLREIHHRVKNNMQIISSLLRIQARTIEDKATREMFQVGQKRIKTMALIHEKLFRAEDLAKIDFSDYLEGLTSHLMSVYGVRGAPINLKLDITGVYLDINRAIPCGLIINELVTNSLKHAFSPGNPGTIEIRMEIHDGRHQLLIKDNGRGFPEDKDFRKLETLGMQIVLDLIDQMNGTIDLDRQGGTEFKIFFS